MNVEALDNLYNEYRKTRPEFGLKTAGNFAVLGMTKRIASVDLQKGVELYFDLSPNQTRAVLAAATEVYTAYEKARTAGVRAATKDRITFLRQRFAKTGDPRHLVALKNLGNQIRVGQNAMNPPSMSNYSSPNAAPTPTSVPVSPVKPGTTPAAKPGKKLLWDPTVNKYVEVDQSVVTAVV